MALMPKNQFSLFVGASGCGKTTFLMQAWQNHEQGRKPWPIMFDPEIKTCGWVIADRTKGEAEERASKLNLKNIEIYGLVDDHSLEVRLFEDPVNLWNKVVAKFQEAHQLLIIDPIGLFMRGNLIDFRCVAMSCISFSRYASSTQRTIVGVHHTTKSRSDMSFLRPQDRVSGSGAFSGYSSTQCMMIEGIESKEGRDFDTLVVVPHMTPKEEYRLVRRMDGYFTILDDHARQATLEALRAQRNRFMRLVDFKRLAITKGLTDQELERWLDSDNPEFTIEGEYVRVP